MSVSSCVIAGMDGVLLVREKTTFGAMLVKVMVYCLVVRRKDGVSN